MSRALLAVAMAAEEIWRFEMVAKMDNSAKFAHDHQHSPNRFAVIPTHDKLDADRELAGRGVTIAFLDSGFYPHPDLAGRIVVFKDLTSESSLDEAAPIEPWQWHGTQTSVVACGDGSLSDGIYCGLASAAKMVMVKVSEEGRITEENIARGIEWVIANREHYQIRVLNISLGGDDDVPCSLSVIDQLAEEAVRQGIAVVVAAGNSGADGRHSIPPANSPSVITVGGYDDRNTVGRSDLDLYHSNFGATADGSIKPEIIAPAMWVAAPILPGTALYANAASVSLLAAAPDYRLPGLSRELGEIEGISSLPADAKPEVIRNAIDRFLRDNKVVAAHYQHVDGTSFAAPIVSSLVAQMIEANAELTPGAIKNILISTADRIVDAPAIRQGYGVVNARRALALAHTEKHSLKTGGCGPPRITDGHLGFTFHDDEATSVALAGDFNDWSPVSLLKDGEGLWQIKIAAPRPGRHEYKFVINENRWIDDPSNGLKVSDNHGGLNSLLVIQGTSLKV